MNAHVLAGPTLRACAAELARIGQAERDARADSMGITLVRRDNGSLFTVTPDPTVAAGQHRTVLLTDWLRT